jgi:RNA polymerase sigma-70 factor (ECF subfamily)
MAQPPTSDPDRAAILRLKAGDPDAFADVYRKHQPGVLNFVHRLSNGNAVLAEDFAQQVFLSFWTHRADYDLEKPLAPLLLTMARNAWLNLAKREEYRRTSALQEDLAPSGPPRRAGKLDPRLEQKELEEALERALAGLEPPVREVFLLSRYHELKYAEIAEVLGISIKTVEARLSRALQALQEKLKDFL